MPFPSLSVILPVYNCGSYIAECLDSIFSQTFQDFEIIIIDDCSTDDTVNVIKRYSDSRILLINKAQHTGYTDSLNLAIQESKGEFIARMDGDDVCLPERFSKQIQFLRENEEVILCGSGCRFSEGNRNLFQPTSYEAIKVKLLFSCPLNHPTVMGRAHVFKNNQYDPQFEPAEDYELWSRVVLKSQTENIPEALIVYRIHENQVSWKKRELQQLISCRIKAKLLSAVGIADDIPAEIMDVVTDGAHRCNVDYFSSHIHFLTYLLQSNNSRHVVNQLLLSRQVLSEKTKISVHYLQFGEEWIVRRLWTIAQLVSLPGLLKALKRIFLGQVERCNFQSKTTKRNTNNGS